MILLLVTEDWQKMMLLVELIQMDEYLEDAPSWGQRRFYLHCDNGDPFYRG